jgi:hypothetical protein
VSEPEIKELKLVRSFKVLCQFLVILTRVCFPDSSCVPVLIQRGFCSVHRGASGASGPIENI